MNCVYPTHGALKLMERIDGTFVQKLAAMYRAADAEDQRIAAEAYAHWFAKYNANAACLFSGDAEHQEAK
ncbi:hypothetical protein [Robbsia andropogonis]|uniref:hypothetical protein n=1 Tax=Robbsia andropogonis TaxID=28092 RepID=UPI00209D19A2|nr:hypothetical protein [Robbsia andropogonis]MCP1118898.1 hypothetical protein [Robbsia andropogonis]MCP1128365.1 hypothetical protein [Robbsia andropogonis]